MPASTIVLKYIPWHHRVVEKGIERSLAVMIMGILVVLERILVVNVFLHRRGRVKLNELVLEFLIAELNWRYRVQVVVVAE